MGFVLDVKFRLVGLLETSLEFLVRQNRTNPVLKELVNLLRSTSVEGVGVQERLELVLDRVEVGVLSDSVNKVVVQAKLLDLVSSLMGENLNK